MAKPGRKPIPIGKRLWWEVDIESGCWNWTRGTEPQGYGKVKLNGRVVRASRAAWTHFVGPIPDGKFVLHKCDNPLCINPEHLYLGTHFDNMRDAKERGRMRNGHTGRIPGTRW